MPDFSEYLVRGKRGYLIGIGGVSMSPLAEVLSDAGLIISGSDIAESERTSHLREKGIVISIGHDAANITSDIDFVVRTAAAHDENPEIVRAHEEGIIHFHDTDYFAQKEHNCDLINLEDMLQNGTVITGTLIEKPHTFATACNIATQIVAQVASNQYGGQSISLTHLAPFVQISREKIRASVRDEFDAVGVAVTEDKINSIAEKRLREEIRRGVQTIQYQVVTLLTTNGQAPFVTVFMYLGEAKNQQEKDDLALIIEETLLQRYQGVKNEKGVWVTPAFPKLIYVLEEDNIREGSKYWELTKLAAKCTAKRMVPDYISEKKMLELKVDKNGNGQIDTGSLLDRKQPEKVMMYRFNNVMGNNAYIVDIPERTELIQTIDIGEMFK